MLVPNARYSRGKWMVYTMIEAWEMYQKSEQGGGVGRLINVTVPIFRVKYACRHLLVSSTVPGKQNRRHVSMQKTSSDRIFDREEKQPYQDNYNLSRPSITAGIAQIESGGGFGVFKSLIEGRGRLQIFGPKISLGTFHNFSFEIILKKYIKSNN